MSEVSKEIQELYESVNRMKHVLRMICEVNPLRNDRDAFVQALCEYGLGDIDEEPRLSDFGLPY